MTLSVISTDSNALSAGLPFSVNPDDCTFAILLAQEPSGSLSVLQSSGGTLLGVGTNGGGGTSSTVTLAAGSASVGTFALSAGTTLAVAGNFWQSVQPVSGTMSISGTPTVVLSAGGTVALAAPLPPGSNALGTVAVSGGTVTALPIGTQTVAGTLALSTGNTVTVLGAFYQATQPVSLAALPALPAGSNAIGAVTQSGAWTVGLSAGQTITLGGSNSVTLAAGSASVGTFSLASSTFTLAGGTSNIGTVAFAASSSVTLVAGTSNIGTVTTSPSGTQTIAASGNLPTYLNAVSSGGASSLRTINTAGSNMATSVKASGGNIYSVDVSNGTTATIYFRMFNLATAPTAGTSTPLMGAIAIAAGGTWTFRHDIGLSYSTGIAFDVTTGSMADSDTGTIATANQVTVTIGYK